MAALRLEHFSTSALFREMQTARESGDLDRVREIQWLLADRLRRSFRVLIRSKVSVADASDLESAVVEAAGGSLFRGVDRGDFVAWLRGIARRAVAEHYRAGRRRPATCSLDVAAPVAEQSVDAADRLDRRAAIENALAELRPDHRKVVERAVIAGYSATDACKNVPGMSEQNVHKIASRFRRRLQELVA